MHVENITSNAMSLDRNGQSMLIQVYEKEIDRLNNIIDELEKYLIEMSDRAWDDNGAYDDVLDKLKELKENNKDV